MGKEFSFFVILWFSRLVDWGDYLIPAFKDGLWGYINAEGVIKIPFRYRRAGQFANGVAEVQFGRRHNGIDIEDLTPGHDHPITIDRHGKIVKIT